MFYSIRHLTRFRYLSRVSESQVRLQVVARTTVPDVDQATRMRNLYSTPGFEGTSPSSTTQDAYPRRAFTVSVAPRSLQGVRL